MKTIVRLDKYLADMAVGSRSDVKTVIRKGRVTVNGAVVRQPETKIYTAADTVTVDGDIVGYVHYEYYMLNKPAGVISASEDKKAQTVLDLIDSKKRKDLFPVGRLDKDTEGLLLITNDGALAHQLLSPQKHVSKIYYAKVRGVVTQEDVQAFAAGLTVDETFKAMPARLEILSAGDISEIHLEIHEGKFHQVKRMFEAVGKEVIYLQRLSMGPLVLEQDLVKGAYRPLTDDELIALKAVGDKRIPSEMPVTENMNPKIKLPEQMQAALFDLDGTLIDSMWVWRDIDIEYLARFHQEMPDDLQEAISGISITQTAVYMKERFHIPDPIEKMIADWNEMAYEKYCREIPLKAGVRQFLEYLKQQGISCAIATSNSRQLAEAVLKAHGITDYFQTVITGEDVHRGKPAPDVYLEAAARLNVKPENCVVFEDIVAGITAAQAAGMTCVAVEDDFSAGQREEKRRLAQYYIHDYYDLL